MDNNQQYQNSNTTIIVKNPKSTGTAVLLTVLFGPLGLFYATTTGGLIMLFGGGLFCIITLGFGALITWPICIIWAYMAVEAENNQQNGANTQVIQHRNTYPNTPQQIAPSAPILSTQGGVQVPLLEQPAPLTTYNATTTGSVSKNEVYADIEQLSKLKEMEILTPEEFNAQKNILLNKLSNL